MALIHVIDALLFAYRHLNTDLFLAWSCQQWNGEVPIGKLMLFCVLSISLTHVNCSIVSYIFKGKSPFTLKHGKPDHEATEVSVKCYHCSTFFVSRKLKSQCCSISVTSEID